MYICIYAYICSICMYTVVRVWHYIYNWVCTVHKWIFNSLLHHMPTGIHISMMSNGGVEFRSWWARAYTCKRMKSPEHMCPGWMVAFSIACKSRHTSKLSRYGMLSLGVAKAAAGPILWFSQNPFGPETWYPQPRENSHLAKAVNAMYSSHRKVTGARKTWRFDSSFLPWYMSYSIEAGIICQGILPSRCCGHPQLPQPSSVFRSPWHCYSRLSGDFETSPGPDTANHLKGPLRSMSVWSCTRGLNTARNQCCKPNNEPPIECGFWLNVVSATHFF